MLVSKLKCRTNFDIPCTFDFIESLALKDSENPSFEKYTKCHQSYGINRILPYWITTLRPLAGLKTGYLLNLI
jgi:hypothetical protein